MNDKPSLSMEQLITAESVLEYLEQHPNEGLRGYVRAQLLQEEPGQAMDETEVASRMSRIGKRLNRVEAELGITILSRSKGRIASVISTNEVQHLRSYLRALHRNYIDMFDWAAKRDTRTHVTFASYPSVISYLGPAISSCMLHTYPHLHLHLESCDSTTLAEKVATGVFDLALGFPQELRPALQSELDLQARPAYLVPHSGLVFRYQEKGIHAELLKMASNSQVDAKTLVEQVRTQPIAAASARIHHWAWNQFFQVPQGLNSGGRIYAPTTRASFQFAACGAGLAISSRPAHPHDEIIKRSRQGKVVVFHPVSDPKVKMCFLHPELLGVVNEPRLDPPAEDTHFVIYLRKTTLLQMDQHLLPEVTALLALVRALTNGEESFERTLRDVGQRGLIRRYRFEHGKLWHDFLN